MSRLAALLLSLLALACTSTPDGRRAIDLEYVAALTGDAQIVVQQTALLLAVDDPELAQDVGDFGTALDSVYAELRNAIATEGSVQPVLTSIDTLLGLVARMADYTSSDPIKQNRVRASAYLVQGVLRIIRRRVEAGGSAGAPPPAAAQSPVPEPRPPAADLPA